MQSDTSRNTTTGTQAGSGAIGQLARLHELNHYKVADGDPDVRGWDVKTSDGMRAGKVDDLIVDTDAMQVRYLDVELDRKTLELSEDRHVLVPIGNARLDDEHDDILLGSMTAAQVATLQPYQHGQPIAGSDSTQRHADPSEFFGKRGGSGAVQRMTLSEEELRVGTRSHQAGEVDVHKTVETEHVSRNVPVSHEEVTIERRAVSSDTPGDTTISEDEVRIPLSAEEVVMEKRAVPKEEVVIKKKTVQDEQTVEADIKKERLDVDRSGDVTKRH